MSLKEFYKGKKVLITGNCGFKGSWLTLYLEFLGATVYGITKNEPDNNKMYQACRIQDTVKQYFCDIQDAYGIKKIIMEVQPDVAFHLAAQPITLKSYSEPLHAFSVNGMGTANFLDAFREYPKECNVVIVTSDKCYKNNEWVWGYRETDRLEGRDPYSASKSIAEIIFQSYYHSFFKDQDKVKIASCRAGNVIGGGDWSPDRIVPNCIEAWSNNTSIEIRSPESVRPWNYVLDVILGYITVGLNLSLNKINGESFNFGPEAGNEINVLDLTTLLWNYWKPTIKDPYVIKKVSDPYFEHQYLKLSIEKALEILHWSPRTNIETASRQTVEWYLHFFSDKKSIRTYTNEMIKSYHSSVEKTK